MEENIQNTPVSSGSSGLPNKRPADVLTPPSHETKKVKIPENAPEWAVGLFDCFMKEFSKINLKLESIESQGNAAAVKQVSDRVTELESENKVLKSRVDILETKLDELSSRVLSNETYSRRGNLEFHGIPENDRENCKSLVQNVLKDQMNLNGPMPMIRCHRNPRKKPENLRYPRPILARFSSELDRDKIWENRRRLKDSGYFVSENFPEDIESRRKVFYPIIKKANTLDAFRNKVFLVEDRLVISKDDTREQYTVDQLDMLPSELDPVHIATKSDGKVTAFFGRASPLSNHHSCSFKLDGQTFNCVEQYFFYSLAEINGDERAKHKILATDDPVKQKKIGKRLKKSPGHDAENWKKAAPEIMHRAVLAKFQSNERLKQFLLGTGTQKLAEANKHDLFWSQSQFTKPVQTTILAGEKHSWRNPRRS